ncbi:hypothetical protein Clacol_005229 [Clathrus columnatus]|uniref:F-box/LRR-repeat protein n=1 Tax=Clathrus columnatus TaxID=1419009 RepID=A0AAV5ADK4_9AGAM|nr:hypothetical protein Clacol_005229 [Clathrus columnatus]
MSNITCLHFSGALSDVIFRDVTFPRLELFSSIDHFTPEILKFLYRHPSITKLFLSCDNIPDISTEFLPRLEYFSGTLSVAKKVIPGRPITDIGLSWRSHTSEERTDEIIKGFTLSSTPILRFSSTALYPQDNRFFLITTIARYFPYLQSLQLINLALEGVSDRLFVNSLTRLLPSLKHLQHLTVASIFSIHDMSELQEVETTVEWRRLCPQLNFVVFPNYLRYVAKGLEITSLLNPLHPIQVLYITNL